MRCRSEQPPSHAAAATPSIAGLAASFVAAFLAALATAGCSLITDPFATNDFSGDPYPIAVELDSGALRLSTREVGEISESRPTLLDVMAPFSIIDRGEDSVARVETLAISLLSSGPAGLVARARLEGSFIELHPCAAGTASADGLCSVGGAGTAASVELTIGADLLAGDALRLDLAQRRMFLLPDIAGFDSQRSDACDAIFAQPFRGGGTLIVGGTELPFVGRRVLVSACAAPVPVPRGVFPLPEASVASEAGELGPRSVPQKRGVDLLLVTSTSFGITVLSEAAYRRYLLAEQGFSEDQIVAHLAALPTSSLSILSGPISGRLTSLPSLALVGKSTQRGACGDIYAHRYLTRGGVDEGRYLSPCSPRTLACPCDRLPCGAPAAIEISEAVDVLVIADGDPLLTGLRTELRPDQAEVDGVIGTDLLARLTVDIDYPNNRVLMRCAGDLFGPSCMTRPELPNLNSEYENRMRRCLPPLPEPGTTTPS